MDAARLRDAAFSVVRFCKYAVRYNMQYDRLS